jgi:type III secretion protein X
MSDIRFNSLVFDRGIESITHARPETMSTMPERGDVPPADVGARAQLDGLLQLASMNDRLDAALRPRLANRALLTPGRFHAALGAVHQWLRQSAQQCASDSDNARVLNRATRLLGEETSLRELVQMFRSALYQG